MTLQIPVVGVAPGLLAGRHRAAPPSTTRRPGSRCRWRSRAASSSSTTRPSRRPGACRGLPPGFDPAGLELDLRVGLAIVPGRSEAAVPAAAGAAGRPLRPRAALRHGHAARHGPAAPGRPTTGRTGATTRSPLQVAAPDDAPAVAAAARRMGFGARHRRPLRRRAGRHGGGHHHHGAGRPGAPPRPAGGAGHRPLAGRQRGRPRPRPRPAPGARRDRRRPRPGGARSRPALRGGGGGLAWASALGRLGGLLADRLARGLLPDFPFRPETFFRFPAWLLGAALALAVALGGARRARPGGRGGPGRAGALALLTPRPAAGRLQRAGRRPVAVPRHESGRFPDGAPEGSRAATFH